MSTRAAQRRTRSRGSSRSEARSSARATRGRACGRSPRSGSPSTRASESLVTAIAPATPVIVGVGFAQERSEDPSRCPEAFRLMERAVRNAAADAGSDALLGLVESISVPQGMWQYRNPGKLLADALGCPSARSILSDLGVLQLTLLSEACRAIATGEEHVAVVTGGEAKFRELCAAITGQTVVSTDDADAPPPDV